MRVLTICGDRHEFVSNRSPEESSLSTPFLDYDGGAWELPVKLTLTIPSVEVKPRHTWKEHCAFKQRFPEAWHAEMDERWRAENGQ